MTVVPKNVPDRCRSATRIYKPRMTRIDTNADEQIAIADESPRAVYIHVPFCAQRCGYCNFTLVAGPVRFGGAVFGGDRTRVGRHRRSRGTATGRHAFFGGGTPTQLSPAQLSRLIELVLPLGIRRRRATNSASKPIRPM